METRLQTGTPPITLFAETPELRQVKHSHVYDETSDIPSMIDFPNPLGHKSHFCSSHSVLNAAIKV